MPARCCARIPRGRHRRLRRQLLVADSGAVVIVTTKQCRMTTTYRRFTSPSPIEKVIPRPGPGGVPEAAAQRHWPAADRHTSFLRARAAPARSTAPRILRRPARQRRTRLLADRKAPVLDCIRCGACLNHCRCTAKWRHVIPRLRRSHRSILTPQYPACCTTLAPSPPACAAPARMSVREDRDSEAPVGPALGSEQARPPREPIAWSASAFAPGLGQRRPRIYEMLGSWVRRSSVIAKSGSAVSPAVPGRAARRWLSQRDMPPYGPQFPPVVARAQEAGKTMLAKTFSTHPHRTRRAVGDPPAPRRRPLTFPRSISTAPRQLLREHREAGRQTCRAASPAEACATSPPWLRAQRRRLQRSISA